MLSVVMTAAWLAGGCKIFTSGGITADE
jgi:hypothetical protein